MTEDSAIRMTDQLYQLTEQQAQEVLKAFLDAEANVFVGLLIGGVDLNYSERSVVEALRHIARDIELGLLSEEAHSVWFARLGYYFGESLRRSKPNLRWGLGHQDYAFANHPVIIGFADEEEAPVITICKNMVMAVAEHLSPDTRIDKGVRNWFAKEIAGA